MSKLRTVMPLQRKSCHASALTSGIALGLAVPAFASGVYQSMFPFFILFHCYVLTLSQGFLPERRAQVPEWDTLVFIYGVLLVPVLFTLLVGVNMAVWSNSRINYVFIFG
jgi:hypothetical protein